MRERNRREREKNRGCSESEVQGKVLLLFEKEQHCVLHNAEQQDVG